MGTVGNATRLCVILQVLSHNLFSLSTVSIIHDSQPTFFIYNAHNMTHGFFLYLQCPQYDSNPTFFIYNAHNISQPLFFIYSAHNMSQPTFFIYSAHNMTYTLLSLSTVPIIYDSQPPFFTYSAHNMTHNLLSLPTVPTI